MNLLLVVLGLILVIVIVIGWKTSKKARNSNKAREEIEALLVPLRAIFAKLEEAYTRAESLIAEIESKMGESASKSIRAREIGWSTLEDAQKTLADLETSARYVFISEQELIAMRRDIENTTGVFEARLANLLKFQSFPERFKKAQADAPALLEESSRRIAILKDAILHPDVSDENRRNFEKWNLESQIRIEKQIHDSPESVNWIEICEDLNRLLESIQIREKAIEAEKEEVAEARGKKAELLSAIPMAIEEAQRIISAASPPSFLASSILEEASANFKNAVAKKSDSRESTLGLLRILEKVSSDVERAKEASTKHGVFIGRPSSGATP